MLLWTYVRTYEILSLRIASHNEKKKKKSKEFRSFYFPSNFVQRCVIILLFGGQHDATAIESRMFVGQTSGREPSVVSFYFQIERGLSFFTSVARGDGGR